MDLQKADNCRKKDHFSEDAVSPVLSWLLLACM